MNLEVPDTLSFSRRSSPRAEELVKNREIKKQETTRQRLDLYRSFDDAVALLMKSSNIVILSGAGVSTSVGIPDFRSDKGLYKTLSEQLGITEPEEFFSNSFFTENPLRFFKYVKGVLPRAIPCADGSYRSVNPRKSSRDSHTHVPKYSPTHAFLALLQSKKKLLTNYTQNIDGLELAAGLDSTRFIQCHGSWDTATCMTCGKIASAKKYLPIAFAGGIPFCKCSMVEPSAVAPKTKRKREAKSRTVSSKKRKRANAEEEDYGSDHSSDQYDNALVPRGLLKPGITFFEDPITTDYQARLKSDKHDVDLLIVVGTSLKVAPIQQMLYQVPPTVPQIYISKERFSGALCSLPGVQVDIELLGESDVIMRELCRRAGWTNDLEKWLWEPGLAKTKRHPETTPSVRYESSSEHGHPTKKTKRETSSDIPELPIRKKDKQAANAHHTIKEDITITTQTTPSTNSTTKTTTTKISKISQYDGPSDHIPQPPPINHKPQQQQPQTQQISIHEQQISSPHSHPSHPDPLNQPFDPTASELRPEPTESKVKIELVEGTTHQWRVTRKK